MAACRAEYNGGPGQGGQYSTIMFSCHDSGWVSDPGNKLNVRGSRASLGYLGVFSYNIPLFFAGEEFDNEVSPPRGPALHRVLVCTHKTFTKGRHIFSRSTENRPAFPCLSRIHRRSASSLRPTELSSSSLCLSVLVFARTANRRRHVMEPP